MPTYHIARDSVSGKWAVKKAGSSRASGKFDNQNDATKIARKFARSSGGGEVIIHDRHGRIRNNDTIAPSTNHHSR